MSYQIDFAQLAEQLSGRVEEVCRHLLPDGCRDGANWSVGSVHGEEGQSLKVALHVINGVNAGFWKDFEGDKTGDLLELWALRRSMKRYDAAKEALAWLGMKPEELRRNEPVKTTFSLPVEGFVKPPKRQSKTPPKIIPKGDENLKRLAARLRNNTKAQSWLQERSFTPIVERFGLGLSLPYPSRKTGLTVENELVFPVINREGYFVSRYGKIDVPGVTVGNVNEKGKRLKAWAVGEPLAYHSKAVTIETSIAIITEGQKDLWILDEYLASTPYARNVVLLSSTHGTNIPHEWLDENYWELFDRIFIATDNDGPGDTFANNLAGTIGQPTYRVRVPHSYNQKSDSGTDISDFVLSNPPLRDFERLLKLAPETMSESHNNNQEDSHKPLDSVNPGSYGYAPIDVNGGFDKSRSLLHYPLTIHQVEKQQKFSSSGLKAEDAQGEEVWEVTERLRTIVLRSDQKILQVITPKAPSGTSTVDMVLRLNDGTIIKEKPTTNSYSTWDWQHAQQFMSGAIILESTETLVNKAISHLKGSVWLPHSEDYALLALTVLATYVQEAFDAVPYVLANGIAGSGKSQLGMAMAELSCNSNVVGAITAATMSREINNTSGLLVIDDLEGIAASSKNNTQVNDMLQFLKVGYKKATSNRRVTEGQGEKAKVVNLNLFGIKFITNTQGVEGILGTRMLTIHTRKMVEGQTISQRPLPTHETYALRQQLHGWAFSNVAKLYDHYCLKYSENTNRDNEISAPLRVIAHFCNSQEISDALEKSLGKQDRYRHDDNDPVAVLLEAVDNLIQRGYYTPTLQHIVMEMSTLVEDGFGQESRSDIPDWSKPEWVSRQLKQHDLIEHQTKTKRVRLYGKSLRTVTITRQKLDAVILPFTANGGVVEKQEARAFCKGCDDCPYAAQGCDMMSARLKLVSSK